MNGLDDDEPATVEHALLHWSMKRMREGHKVTDEERKAFRAGYDMGPMPSTAVLMTRELMIERAPELRRYAISLHGCPDNETAKQGIAFSVLMCDMLWGILEFDLAARRQAAKRSKHPDSDA